MRQELERIREWANTKLQSGQEPPWAWYQYMKLRETVDAILGGMSATVTRPDSRESVPRSERRLRLVASTDPQETAPRRRGQRLVRLPM